MSPASKPRELALHATVEFEDVDAYGIAHHASLILYLERVRVRFFDRLGLDIGRSQAVPVIAGLEAKFRRPARFRDILSVALFVREVTEFTLVLGYRLRRGEELIASASTTLAFMHLSEQRLMPLPDEFRQGLIRWSEEPGHVAA